jgi:diadenosine tetraphosphate (Ap4A) HIT family hydrolase
MRPNCLCRDSSVNDCPFCLKLSRLAELSPDELIWRFSNSVAMLGPWQRFTGYCVLVSRTHAAELSGLSEAERREFLDEMCILAKAIETAFSPRKMNYELLGNQVPHLHWHLFPRSADDRDPLRPVWFALDRAEHDKRERERLRSGPVSVTETAERLRRQLSLLTGERP